MPLSISLWCVALLLATAPLGAAVSGRHGGGAIVYGASLTASLVLLAVALLHLSGGSVAPLTTTLPLGLPWLGAHFRLDGLSSFFLVAWPRS